MRCAPLRRRRTSARTVTVAVVKVRIVRMAMGQRRMAMDVRMRLNIWNLAVMLVLVMGVVNMPMLVLQPLVGVPMVMPFHEVQRHSDNHQRRSCQQLHGKGFPEHRDR